MRLLRHIFSWLAALCITGALHASEVDSVLINVKLSDDGSALVTELWQIDADDSITEWYRVIDNLGDMTVRDLQVQENGRSFISEGDDWDIDRSLEEKAGRCGIVRKKDGCELCWGIGSEGPHTFIISYTLTGLVKGYDDMDGFNFMFLARNQSDPPQYVEATIFKDSIAFSSDNARIWGFGFNGEVNFEDGSIVARSTEPFVERSGLIVLAGFNKGIFSPGITGSGTFGDMVEEALKGSDYEENDGSSISFFEIIVIGLIGLVALLVIYAFIDDIIKKKKRRRELLGCKSTKDVPWFRSVPAHGSIRKSYNVYKTIDHDGKASQQLIAAYVMRLFYKKALSVTIDEKGRKVMKINEYPDSTDESAKNAKVDAGGVVASNDQSDMDLEKKLHEILQKAAGENGLLENKELRRWSRNDANSKLIYNWMNKADDSSTVFTLDAKDVREVFGLRNFLQDYTLIEERGVAEVGLWNNYLIFASLFGIADKVYKEIKKICPDYEQLAGLSIGDESIDLIDVILMSNYYSSNMYLSASTFTPDSIPSSGRGGGFGGFSSFGGGGGFSGGGSGGGGR